MVAPEPVRASSTSRAYAREWSRFARWCSARGLIARPARGDIVALYVVELAERGRAVSTIARVLNAIGDAHARAGLPSPRSSSPVREALSLHRRSMLVQCAALVRAVGVRPRLAFA